MGERSSANAYRTLADLIDGLGANGIRVDSVETNDIDESAESLAVTLDIEIPLDGGSPLRIPDTDDESAEAASGSPEERPSESAADDAADAGTDGDSAADGAGTYQCDAADCSARFQSSAERDLHVETEHRQPEVPAHRNEAALELAYEAFDSFPEMTEALDVDVTPQTVRRHAIDAGIHDPGGDAGDASPDQPTDVTDEDTGPEDPSEESGPEARRVTDGSGGAVASSDAGSQDAPGPASDSGDVTEPGESATELPGVDLPERIRIDDLRTVAVGARTLREAARELDLPRDRTRELLADLGLLELVHGRVAERLDRAEREERFEEWLAERREADGTA